MSLRILTLSQMYPNPLQPTLGTFIEQRCKALAELTDVRVAAPLPYFPAVKGFGRFSRIAKIKSVARSADGLMVMHPRYLMLPRTATWLQGPTMARSLDNLFAGRRSNWRPDVIDAHFAFPDGYAGVQLARRLGCLCTITCHGGDLALYPSIPLVGGMIRSTLGKAAAVIAVSPALRDAAVGLGCPDERAKVLPNGVDCRQFVLRDQADCRQQLGLQADVPLAVCVGSLIERKNQIVLLEALAQLRRQWGLRVNLALVGQGPLREFLGRRAAELGLEQQVIFAGNQSYDQVPLWISAADWLVLASHREGWATVYHEAMACGRPVITSNVDAAPFAVCSEELGLVVPDLTAGAFSAALHKASLREYNPQHIRDHARQHDWRNWAANYMNILADLSSRSTIRKQS